MEGRSRGAGILEHTRIEVYCFATCALSSLHANLDLPLACLERAQTCLTIQMAPPCQSGSGLLALAQLEIFVRYGFYHRSQELFDKWLGHFPSISWLHEELVMLHALGVFQSVLKTLAEVYVTKVVHWNCRSIPCLRLHVKWLLHPACNWILRLQGFLYRCLSDPALHKEFRQDCENGLQLVKFFLLTATKINSGYRDRECLPPEKPVPENFLEQEHDRVLESSPRGYHGAPETFRHSERALLE